jgi:N-acetylglucosamine-6-phosphate deacetylase
MMHTHELLVINAHDGQWLYSKNGVIQAMGKDVPPDIPTAEVIPANGLRLLPGLIDVHVHGAVGHDTMDATPSALAAMAQFYARHGVTGFLATTWTDSRENITSALENVRQCCGLAWNGANLLGAHLEGPYLNPARAGAQNQDYVRLAKRDEALAFLEHGVIRILSLAPEFPENTWLMDEAIRRGIVVSVAHTNATYEQTAAAIQRGLRHSTHSFNAQTGLHHRQPGVVGAVLTHPEVTCELIADNFHVHPAVMKLLWQVKGPDKLVLISDAVRVAGLGEGEYRLDTRPVTVRTGTVRLADGTLAGSMLTMDVAMHLFQQATGESLENIWPTGSLNPARVLGLDHKKGSLVVGKDADFILMDEAMNIHLTVVMGKVVYRRETHVTH